MSKNYDPKGRVYSDGYRARHWQYVDHCEWVLRKWCEYFLDDMTLGTTASDDAMVRYASKSVVFLEKKLKLIALTAGNKTAAYETALKWKKEKEMQLWLTTEPPPRELLHPSAGVSATVPGKLSLTAKDYSEVVATELRQILARADHYERGQK